jgi:hypothetical protein
MVASGVLPVGAMRPRVSASSVISRAVRGRLADFRTASAAARKVISSHGNEGNDGPGSRIADAALLLRGRGREVIRASIESFHMPPGTALSARRGTNHIDTGPWRMSPLGLPHSPAVQAP